MAVIAMLVTVMAPRTYAQDPPNLWWVMQTPKLVPALSNGSGAWGDYDGDGDLDLYVIGWAKTTDASRPSAQLYINDGDYFLPDPQGGEEGPPATDYSPVFFDTETRIRTDFAAWRGAVAWSDFDADGRIDVASTGIATNGVRTTRIYRNTFGEPGASYLSAEYIFPGVSEGDLAWGDFDNDGDPDLLVCGTDAGGNPSTRLLENRVRDDGGFTEHPVGIEDVWKCSVDWGDIDNDRDLDLAITGVNAAQEFVTRVYRNEGGTFSDIGAPLAGLLAGSVAFGDGDADGDLDLLQTGGEFGPFLVDGRVFVYRNDGGVFTRTGTDIRGAYTEDGVGRYAGDAKWGDFNNDGYPDFFVSGFASPNSTESGRTYESLGQMKFSYSTIGFSRGIFLGGAYGSTFWGDYDNDGDLDLFSMGTTAAGNPYYRENQNWLQFYPLNQPPQPPASPTSSVSASTVVFSWEPGTDGNLPAAALTYNLRVGTFPGGDNIMPAMSSFSGKRRLARMGNAGHNLGWQLKGLPPGTYYWSVQSVDTSFSGSAFVPEMSFTVGAE